MRAQVNPTTLTLGRDHRIAGASSSARRRVGQEVRSTIKTKIESATDDDDAAIKGTGAERAGKPTTDAI